MIDFSTLVKTQFPEHYVSDGPNLIAFMEAYYEWLEQSSNVLSSQLLELRDIDSTVDEFVNFFKRQYLHNLPNIAESDLRNFIKHSGQLFEAKGTPQATKLLLRLVFGVDAEIYHPGDDILRASAGQWKVPIYLECAASPFNKQLIGKKIIGGSSGATAIVENVIRRVAEGHYYDIIYLSHLEGSFEYNEHVVDSTGELARAPLVIGSLNKVLIIDGGRGNSIGDIFLVTSRSGRQAVARVTAIANATGQVEFTLEDGGTGYSTNAYTIVSDKLINFAGTPSNANSSITRFRNFETIEQPLYEVSFLVANNNFANGDVIEAYTSGTWIKQANGLAIVVNQAGASGNVVIQVESGDFRYADVIRKSGNTVAANISNTVNQTATANVVGSNTSSLGAFNTNGTFRAFNNKAQIRGRSSNTVANIASFGTGTGADFSVGTILDSETVVIYTDLLSANNTANIPLLDVYLDGSGSAVGRVINVTINAGGSGYSNGTYIAFSGGGANVASVTVAAGGTNYANGEHVVAGSGSNTALIVTTNTTGGITTVTVIDGGSGHVTPPTLTVSTTSGSGANLVAVLSNANTANASISTNSIGGITSVTINNEGGNYSSAPSLSISGGTGANLAAVMHYGYGFVKFPEGDANSTINSCLRSQTVQLGTIGSISGISPGTDYNHSPFIRVVEPFVSGLAYHNAIITTSNQVGSFAIGEQIRQDITSNVVILSYGGISGNTNFDNGEIISQSGNTATGIVYDHDGAILRLANVSGTFVTTSNSYTQISGSETHAIANVSLVTPGTKTVTVKGTVKASNSTAIIIQPKSINNIFDMTLGISGAVTGATANIGAVNYDYSSMTMGNNAVVTATVQTANGVATELEVISSGYGYNNQQAVTLTSETNPNDISGIAQTIHEGRGQGFFTSTDGFLSEDKYLQDGIYYQTYSYEVQTSLSLDRYSDLLKQIVHISGTILFGKALLKSQLDLTVNVDSEPVYQFATDYSPSLDFSIADNSQYVPLVD